MTTLAEFIHSRRLFLLESDKSFSLRQVASRIGVEPSYLSKLERGERAPLSEEKTRALALDLGLDPDVLLAMSGKISKDLQEVILQRPQLFAELIHRLKNLPDHAVLRLVREVRDGDWESTDKSCLQSAEPEAGADLLLLGAVIGDIAGSTYEGRYDKVLPALLIGQHSRFTDDTVLSCAVAEGLLAGLADTGREKLEKSAKKQAQVVEAIARTLKDFARAYPHRGYGGSFRKWAAGDSLSGYGSFGNGAVMRTSFAGWYAASLAEAELFGRLSARPTHNHPEAEEAAALLCGCIHLLKQGGGKREVLRYAGAQYDLHFTLDALRPIHAFNITAKATLIVALVCFLESASFEHCLQLAISMGGDSDTLAATAGALAEAHYCVSPALQAEAASKLDDRLLEVMRHAASAFQREGLWRLGKNSSDAPLACECVWPTVTAEAEAVTSAEPAPPCALLGVVIGDLAGSSREGGFDKTMPESLIEPESRFTDESVLSCAVAEGLLAGIAQTGRSGLSASAEMQDQLRQEMLSSVRRYARIYRATLRGDQRHSGFDNYRYFENSAAMRVAFPGWYATSLAEAQLFGRLAAQVSYQTADALESASVVAACIYILKSGGNKQDVLRFAQASFNLHCTLAALRPVHAFNPSARGTVPAALLAFLESESFEHCIRLALSLGGDCDTVAAIAGSLAEAHYRIEPSLCQSALARLDERLNALLQRITEALAGEHLWQPGSLERDAPLVCACAWPE